MRKHVSDRYDNIFDLIHVYKEETEWFEGLTKWLLEEESILLTLLDVDEKTIEEISKDLCAFFNQESVIVTYSAAMIRFLKEKI